MLRSFVTDPLYLLRYYALTFVLYAAAVAALAPGSVLAHAPYAWAWLLIVLPLIVPTLTLLIVAPIAGIVMAASGAWEPFHLWHLLLVPAGMYLGVMSASFMHIASHKGIKPAWLNRLVGELCAAHQLSVFNGWTIVHMLHHQHPDDPELDPHPPAGYSFSRYVSVTKKLMQRCMTRTYLRKHGDSPRVRRIWAATETMLIVNRILRAIFWLLLLGPAVFACLYVPSLAVNILNYCHFNYSTHRPRADGSVEILNLDERWFCRALNAIAFGGYYHKNHHLKPTLFNPKGLTRPSRTLEPGFAVAS